MVSGNDHADCNRCHTSHHAAGRLMNLKAADPNALCAKCHQGKEGDLVQQGAIQMPEGKGLESDHLFQSRTERSREGQTYVRTYEGGGRKGVLLSGCDGCHDPHAKDKKKLKEVAFDARGDWVGSKPALTAQICFGCHAGPEAVRMRAGFGDVGDIGARFARGARSQHAMGRTAGERPDLPSLNGMRSEGRLDCTSCHDNPDEAGPRGPHVSPYPHLLCASYGREMDGGVGERSNDLCYKCHSQVSIEGNQSFPLHREHIRGFVDRARPGGSIEETGPRRNIAEEGLRTLKDLKPGRQGAFMAGFGEPTPCATCHNPHGSIQNPALIDFDTTVVTPSMGGGISFRQTGPRRGSCTLTCHGHSHVNAAY